MQGWATTMLLVMIMATTWVMAIQAEAQLGQQGEEGLVKEHLNLQGKEKFLGTFSTSTRTMVIASTSTVFLTCLSGTANPVVLCGGRRKKRNVREKSMTFLLDDYRGLPGPILEGSTEGVNVDGKERDTGGVGEEGHAEKFLGIQLWTTTAVTTSVTVFYTNTSTTVRISFYCAAGGLNLPPISCIGA
ncbi:uncharacterized protein LOC121856989 [Homarus americanus]|uniref:Uncharacterized protein n=1 Tax=Homarus americanus TaxID=6706 RepID=A0A8J5JAE0_HOMAM|nr:uncharacterized protein LOC121856989 [Homarus americanus]KAG7153828.1 hypothetical protein Hamer_G017638 [Homarus americanus]